MCCVELGGESSNSADRPRKDGEFATRLSTIDGLGFLFCCGVCSEPERVGLVLDLASTILGELSGESEGKEVRDLSVVAVVGVFCCVETAEFRVLTRDVPDL